MSTSAENELCSENWRSTPGNLEEREKWLKKKKKTFIAAITATAQSRAPVSVNTCPRAAPEESRRSSAQFALWVHVSAA